MGLELVKWEDAHVTHDAVTESDYPEEFICESVGWVIVEKNRRWLRITAEITPNGARCVTRVPLKNVKKRIKLREVKRDRKA